MKKSTKETKLSLENFQIAKFSNSHLIMGGDGGDGDISDNDPLKSTKCLQGSAIVVTEDDNQL